MFGGNGGGYAGSGDCAEGYGLGYVAGGGRLQQYAHFAPHQNVWHHHHTPHHDSYGLYKYSQNHSQDANRYRRNTKRIVATN